MIEFLTIVIILLWVVPLAIKAKVNKSTILRMLLGLLLGGIPVVIAAIILNIQVEYRLLPALGLSGISFTLVQAACTGFLEEGLKLIGALLCAIKMKSERKIDYILVFGSVGAGFEIMESIAAASDLLTMAIRVLFALHVVWLYVEGGKYFQQKQGKTLALLGGYITVALFHGLFDSGLLLLAMEGASDDTNVIGFILVIIGLIANLVLIIKTMISANKSIKEVTN